jgi:hypothetical protein
VVLIHPGTEAVNVPGMTNTGSSAPKIRHKTACRATQSITLRQVFTVTLAIHAAAVVGLLSESGGEPPVTSVLAAGNAFFGAMRLIGRLPRHHSWPPERTSLAGRIGRSRWIPLLILRSIRTSPPSRTTTVAFDAPTDPAP